MAVVILNNIELWIFQYTKKSKKEANKKLTIFSHGGDSAHKNAFLSISLHWLSASKWKKELICHRDFLAWYTDRATNLYKRIVFRAKTSQLEFLALCGDLAHATHLRFSLPPDTDTLRFTRWSRRRCCSPGKNTQFAGRARLGLELTSPPWPWAWERGKRQREWSRRLFTEGRAAATCVATWVTHSSSQPAKVREREPTHDLGIMMSWQAAHRQRHQHQKWSPPNNTLFFYFHCFPLVCSCSRSCVRSEFNHNVLKRGRWVSL